MAIEHTPRLGLTQWTDPELLDPVHPDQFNADAAALDNLAAIAMQGTAAERPAFGVRGRFYYATDTGALTYDTGTAWTAVNVTDHGELTGLGDDDHPQYALADGSRGNFAAPGDYVDRADQLRIDSEQNVRLWQLEANLLGSTEGMAGWQGEAFLAGQDEIASNTGLYVNRAARLGDGSAGLFASQTLRGAAYSGNLWVAVGFDGTVLTSTDGTNWNRRATPTTNPLYDVAYGNGLWVAVGDSTTFGTSGTLLTSTDGITWTLRANPSTRSLRGVAYFGDLWVAVGDTGNLITSPDGITWTKRTLPDSNGLQSVAYSEGQWVAVGNVGRVLTSPDGITWTLRTTSISNDLQGVASSGSLWVAVGNGGTLITSPDGITWTLRTTPAASTNLFDAAYADGLWVVVGGSGILLTSTDGITWTLRTTSTTNALWDVAYGNGLWVVGGYPGLMITSTDGMSWTEILPKDDGTITLNTVTLPTVCDSVYLLTDKTVDAGVTETYEASLNGGSTWEQVTDGDTTVLSHSGNQLALRFRHQRPAGGIQESSVRWIIGYAF